MKEKNINTSNAGRDQNQDHFSASSQVNDDAQENNQDTNEEQGNYTDEYDNYAPWG